MEDHSSRGKQSACGKTDALGCGDFHDVAKGSSTPRRQCKGQLRTPPITYFHLLNNYTPTTSALFRTVCSLHATKRFCLDRLIWSSRG